MFFPFFQLLLSASLCIGIVSIHQTVLTSGSPSVYHQVLIICLGTAAVGMDLHHAPANFYSIF